MFCAWHAKEKYCGVQLSEKLFRLLLRLYPSHFRNSYEDEALQIFRDRFRDEKGLSPRLRLCFDLVCDFIVIVPREHLRPKPVVNVEILQKSADGVPSLFVLTDEPRSTKSLLSGTIVSILALTVLSFSPAHTNSARYEPTQPLNEPSSQPTLNQRGNAPLNQSGGKNRSESSATKTGTVDAVERHGVIASVAANLKNRHADLTKRLRYTSYDSNSEVVSSAAPLSPQRATETPEHAATFTSIEVKPARSADPQSSRVQILPNGHLIATSVNAIALISLGYNVPANPSDRLSMVPPWVYSERFDIDAQAVPTANRASTSAMFRAVLTDRFRLVMQTDNKSMSVYALVVAQDGPKLTPAPPSDCFFDTGPESCHTFVIGFGHPLNARAVDMDDLAHYIANWTDQPVVNRTSLSGVFTISTEGWRPMRLPPPPPNGVGNVDFTHLQTIDTVLGNLGLKLQKASAPLPVYTVEQIVRP